MSLCSVQSNRTGYRLRACFSLRNQLRNQKLATKSLCCTEREQKRSMYIHAYVHIPFCTCMTLRTSQRSWHWQDNVGLQSSKCLSRDFQSKSRHREAEQGDSLCNKTAPAPAHIPEPRDSRTTPRLRHSTLRFLHKRRCRWHWTDTESC